MLRYKYQTNNREEIWVCAACKKNHTELILLRSWKLIDRKDSNCVCELCAGSTGPAHPGAELPSPA